MANTWLFILLCACASYETFVLKDVKGEGKNDKPNDITHLIEEISKWIHGISSQMNTLSKRLNESTASIQKQIDSETKKISDLRNTLESSIADVKSKFKGSIADVKSTVTDSIADVKSKFKGSIDAVNSSLHGVIGNMESQLENAKTSLNKEIEKNTQDINKLHPYYALYGVKFIGRYIPYKSGHVAPHLCQDVDSLDSCFKWCVERRKDRNIYNGVLYHEPDRHCECYEKADGLKVATDYVYYLFE